jgi:hypothetical protein
MNPTMLIWYSNIIFQIFDFLFLWLEKKDVLVRQVVSCLLTDSARQFKRLVKGSHV